MTLAGLYFKDGQPVVQHLIQKEPGCMSGRPSFLTANLASSTVGAWKFDAHVAMWQKENPWKWRWVELGLEILPRFHRGLDNNVVTKSKVYLAGIGP